jgi:hypothetical protein
LNGNGLSSYFANQFTIVLMVDWLVNWWFGFGGFGGFKSGLEFFEQVIHGKPPDRTFLKNLEYL